MCEFVVVIEASRKGGNEDTGPILGDDLSSSFNRVSTFLVVFVRNRFHVKSRCDLHF
jgi:hypothetical protein